MKILATLFALALLTPVAVSQEAEPPPPPPDSITLNNGNVLTGTVTGMAGGKVTFSSPDLGDIEIPLANITDIVTVGTVELLTKDGERIKRRITGIEGGSLLLSDVAEGAPAAPPLALDQVEAINPPEKVTTWTGSFNLGASLASGNTNVRSANTQAELIRRSETDRLTLDFFWNYADEKNGPNDPVAPYEWRLTQRRTSGGLKYDYFLGEKSYAFGTARAMGDTFADLNLRFNVGGGYGYQWFEEDDLSLSTEIGLGYLYEDFRTPGTSSTETITAQLAYDLRWTITGGLRFLQRLDALPSLEESDDVFVVLDTRLQYDLSQSMFTQLQWVLTYDNTPAPMADRTDNLFIVSVGWNF